MGHHARRAERHAMVRRDLARRDIVNRRVLAAMATVPREQFVPEHYTRDAYADRPLAIGHGQTISQPYIVALMAQEAGLTRRSRALDVGTGSGYHAAILAHLAREVWTIERVPELAAQARSRITALGITNVHSVTGDGAQGYPGAAPFDAIVVAAASPAPPPALLEQLAPSGRLVIPIGPPDVQDLAIFERSDSGYRRRSVCSCCFVPLVAGPWARG